VACCVHCGEELRSGAAFCGNCGESTGRPSPAERAAYGGFWRRFVSLLVDVLVIDIPIGILIAIAVLHGYRFGFHYHPHAHAGQSQITPPSARHQALLQLAGSIPPWLYSAFFMSSGWQGTPGQRLLGLRVTRVDGERISFARASGRYFASVLSAYLIGIGYLMMLWSERNQTLHDRLAGTVVVRS
jgi:uncharacterized RDD family membrane protein YckC